MLLSLQVLVLVLVVLLLLLLVVTVVGCCSCWLLVICCCCCCCSLFLIKVLVMLFEHNLKIYHMSCLSSSPTIFPDLIIVLAIESMFLSSHTSLGLVAVQRGAVPRVNAGASRRKTAPAHPHTPWIGGMRTRRGPAERCTKREHAALEGTRRNIK